jgi:hypothetical protein
MVRQAKETYMLDAALKVNRAFAEQADRHSPLAKKKFWNRIADMHAYKGKRGHVPPAAVIDPVTGDRRSGETGVLQTQATHTAMLGSSATFESQNPQFDDDWKQHVERSVASYRLSSDHMEGMDAPITTGDILSEMQRLGNGKAASPVSGIPNELVKYGGQPMAAMLSPVFNAVWRDGRPPEQWLHGVILYFHKSGPTDDMANYRGITLLDVVSKLFHKVLAKRLLRYAEDNSLLSNTQNAFRPDRGTDDHLYCVSQIVRGRQRERKPTYAFFMDVRKAYDTVWRDGLMYKLWAKGVRGRMWSYIDALYSRSVRQVRVGTALSDAVEIDMGVAQGDTLSCTLYDFYVDDLTDAYQTATPGIPLPQEDTADGAAPRIHSFLFADDFFGAAECPSDLQRGVDAARAWCCKWRVQANIGPKKSAVMVFAPEHADQGLPPVTWGSEVVPEVTDYKYLGVMLASDCGWATHAQYVLEKATKTVHALGAVLHNKRVSTVVRRVVLQAVLRPVVEFGSPVWVPAATDLAKLEQVQTAVLRRMVSCSRNVADDVLRVELACRPYASWFKQRKLEYAYRLLTMPDERLPRLVSQAYWPGRKGKGSKRMHGELVKEVEKKVGVSTAVHKQQGASKASFKSTVNTAVRKDDMATIRRSRQSTVVRYLALVPEHTAFPTQPASYLTGPITLGRKAMLLARADALLPRGDSAAGSCPRCGHATPLNLPHAMLECAAWDAPRRRLWQGIAGVAGAAEVTRVQALPSAEQVSALLRTTGWGGCAGLVNSEVQTFLADVYVSLQAPRCTAQEALDSVADVACQLCHSRGREASLLLCDGCRRGYHGRCLTPALNQVPDGRWLCPHCEPDHPPPTQHISRRQRREGPWPSG